MTLRDKITADIKTAMKDRDQAKLTTLRFLNSEIKNQEIKVRPQELTDQDVMAVLKKLVKQRKDSIEQFKRAGRMDLVDKEEIELAFLESYLPASMPYSQMEVIIDEILASMESISMGQMGTVMKEAMARTAGVADNKMMSEMVKAKIQQRL